MLFNNPVVVAPLSLTGATPTQLLTGAAILPSGYKGFTVTPTNGNIYYGDSSAFTTSTGQPITSGNPLTVATNHPENYYFLAASGTVDVRVTLYQGTN